MLCNFLMNFYAPFCVRNQKVFVDTYTGKLISLIIANKGEYLFALRKSSYKDKHRRRNVVIKGSEINPFSKKEHDDQGYCRFIIDDKKGIAYMGENPDRVDIRSGVYHNMGVGSAMLILALEEVYRRGVREFTIYYPKLWSPPFFKQFRFERDHKKNTLKIDLCELFTTETNTQIKRNERICQIMERRNIIFVDMHEYIICNGLKTKL